MMLDLDFGIQDYLNEDRLLVPAGHEWLAWITGGAPAGDGLYIEAVDTATGEDGTQWTRWLISNPAAVDVWAELRIE